MIRKYHHWLRNLHYYSVLRSKSDTNGKETTRNPKDEFGQKLN
jgi:hypothetical protein